MYSLLFVIAYVASILYQHRFGRTWNARSHSLAFSIALSVFLFTLFMKTPLFFMDDITAAQYASYRSTMPGLLGLLIALAASRYLIGIGFQRLDDWALTGPFALCLVKTGCFYAGCCFGKVTDQWPGVEYLKDKPAYIFQYSAGHILPHAEHSMAVHPVQLYEALGTLLVGVLVWRMRNQWKHIGSNFFFMLSLYLPLRFVTEFFRESTSPLNALGLKSVQVALLGLFFVAVMVIWINEKRPLFRTVNRFVDNKLLWMYYLILVTSFIALSSYFHFIEKSVIVFALGFAFIHLARNTHAGVRSWALRYSFGVYIVLVSTAQAPKDSVSYNSFKVGLSTGNYINQYVLEDSDGCVSESKDFRQEFTVIGIGLSAVRGNSKLTTEKGVTLFGGNQIQTDLRNNLKEEFPVFGAHGYFHADYKWVGLGAGVNLGTIRMADNRTSVDNDLKGYYSSIILPSASLRVGPRNIFYVEYKFADAFPASTPAYQHQYALGTGLGMKNGLAIKLGGVGHVGTYIALSVPVKQVSFHSLYLFGDYDRGFEPLKQRQLLLSMSYNYGKKK
jgi:prolipoprotein diacylglyceryltransferase